MMKHQTEIVIEAGHRTKRYWQDLWLFRELFYFMAWRDIIVRYKQTAIGYVWAVLSPLLTMTVLTIVFSRLSKLPSHGIPYPILVLAGMLPWRFFTNSITRSSTSMITNSSMVSKVYFPRIILPTSSVGVAAVDFMVALGIMMVMMFWYQYPPQWSMLLLPVFMLLCFALSLGVGLWTAALNVKYRDFNYIIPLVVQLGMYVSPVGYSSSVVPERWQLLYSLNPVVGIINGFRRAIIGSSAPLYEPSLLFSVVITTLILATGIMYFRKTERSFADII